MPKYYLDTSIWVDYYLKRGKNGKHALKLIRKIVEENSMILYSDLHINEFKRVGFSLEEINEIFKIAKSDNIKRIHTSREQREEATNVASLKKIPRKDVLHAIAARDNEAIMVATDEHFKKIRNIIDSKLPRELY